MALFGRKNREDKNETHAPQPQTPAAPQQAERAEGEPERKKGLFARLREGLSKTRGNMTDKVDTLARQTVRIDDDFYEELEDILILSDCGMKATTRIIDELKARVEKDRIKDGLQAKEILKQIMVEEMDIPRVRHRLYSNRQYSHKRRHI
jgi:fused signal recognition particle receptor